MAAIVVKRFSDNVSCFAFNGDKTKLALCPNNSEIWIYAKNGEEWEEECVLKEHSELVTGLDWGVKTNRIVSCSQDRNAYVWTLDGGRWKPTLVILRLQRAATFVSWSPKEDKFAVSSGAKLVCICYFEDENDWWVSKHIKKHRSTVLSVKWHPNNVLVATASSDGRARVFSAWTKGVDKRGVVCPVPDPEKKSETFGECLLEWDLGAWVKDVAWSPSGNLLAVIAQDASVSVADVSQGQAGLTTLKLGSLPFSRVVFTSESSVVAAGYDCEPKLFQASAGSVKLVKSLDPQQAGAAGSTSNLKMWQNMDKKGETTEVEKLKTKHQNSITHMIESGGAVITSGLDGLIIFWPK
jgi:actin related protein 2/3 complex subunit 1A/1B